MKDNRLLKFGEKSKETWNKLAAEDAEFYTLTKRGKEGRGWAKTEFLSFASEGVE